MFPESLYRLNPSEVQSGETMKTWRRSATFAQNAVVVAVGLDLIPRDRALLLQHVAVECYGGGATALPTTVVVRAFQAASTKYYGILARSFPDNKQDVRSGNASEQCGLLLPPNYGLLAQAVFAVAAANNSITFSAHGILIPRGNIQQG